MLINGYSPDAFLKSLPILQHIAIFYSLLKDTLITCVAESTDYSLFTSSLYLCTFNTPVFSLSLSLLLLLLWAFLHRVDLIIYCHDLFSFAQHRTSNLHPAVSNFLSLPPPLLYSLPSIFLPASLQICSFLFLPSLQHSLISCGLSLHISVSSK